MKKRERTEKSKYKHESTGDHCTCAAYVAEIMCKKNAENKNVGSLPYKFWNTKPWDWTFKRQLIMANRLIKGSSEEAIVKAINSPEFRKIFSLSHPAVADLVKKYHLIAEAQKLKEKQEVEHFKEPIVRTKSFGKQSILQKLRNIENGEKS